jgi:hypothetical protein
MWMAKMLARGEQGEMGMACIHVHTSSAMSVFAQLPVRKARGRELGEEVRLWEWL